MTIRVLSINTINKIAAGEVIDRPLSIVKELTENSIDAQSSEISIEINRGGRNFISVIDNGIGIGREELEIALERHATSKLNEDDINNIQFLGFRGEALPSIASVSKMKIISKARGANDAWEINVSGGQKSQIKPASQLTGTRIEIRDLFFTTPARLKFLKSEASETSACIELVNKLALSREDISFRLIANEKKIIETKSQIGSILELTSRIEDILGKTFIENTVKFSHECDEIKVYGYVSIPTFNSATSVNQHVFINKRIVRDKVLSIAIRAAYRNLIPHNRFPQVAIYLDIDPQFVDVNVHPTKAEVRFRDEQKVKSIIIDAIRSAITASNLRSSTEVADNAIKLFKPETAFNTNQEIIKQTGFTDLIRNHEAALGKEALYKKNPNDHQKASEKNHEAKYISDFVAKKMLQNNVTHNSKLAAETDKSPDVELQNTVDDTEYPLGFAKCQIDKTYIVAEKSDGLILVDQHAAHERITLERIKQQLKEGNIASQMLLIPEVVDLGQVMTERIVEKKQELERFGVSIERNGISQVLVRQVPAILQGLNVSAFITVIAENIYLFDDMDLIQDKIDEVWGNIACHSSIRAGRVLNLEEMNGLLREIEQTPLSSQCNHGRPTFIRLDLKDIRKIFERL
ncbi:DNA mismatch repair endonuclease MutL [Candidatus Bandiella euplotis]|uniref:DNA mismatch repair protein MutL n=1 Tax=Candidatus Bandiella euplotis TaxID=1664265 RepID=A0ABZ0UMC7_9RICK|nr:DNA mismatch repair endonuclease MutL [Candidatus Bandiella woodruffii]WPX96877.1 DNA mismatch repair protein MutL [Candidatus Bandiella woodruffii]